MDYKSINDNELIVLAHEKDEDAINMLYEKYKPLINKKCSNYFKYVKDKGIEYSDLNQECLIGFEESIRNYNPNNDTLFYTFTNLCMDRQIISLIKKVNRDKNKLLNEAISIESCMENDSSLLDRIEDNSYNPEIDVLGEAEYKDLYERIIKVLTSFEECVFNLKIQGFNYDEISNILDKDTKSIYNAMGRIKDKIKSLK
ncbi:MAG: sigma-70 family RNA polymerase sigma factor [Bacilli bacterium]|nr:sigma-70 family RNA polymerase sigma factor [Bacilli bacterium]